MEIANPRKNFKFRIEVDGINEYLIQKVKLPEQEIESVEHGDTNHNIKTPGKYKCGDMTLTKISPDPDADTWAMDWLMQAQDPDTGGGVLPLNVKKVLVLREMSADGITVLNSWLCDGCWVKKVSPSDRDREGQSENITEEVILSVDKCRKI